MGFVRGVEISRPAALQSKIFVSVLVLVLKFRFREFGQRNESDLGSDPDLDSDWVHGAFSAIEERLFKTGRQTERRADRSTLE